MLIDVYQRRNFLNLCQVPLIRVEQQVCIRWLLGLLYRSGDDRCKGHLDLLATLLYMIPLMIPPLGHIVTLVWLLRPRFFLFVIASAYFSTARDRFGGWWHAPIDSLRF